MPTALFDPAFGMVIDAKSWLHGVFRIFDLVIVAVRIWAFEWLRRGDSIMPASLSAGVKEINEKSTDHID